MNTEMSEERSLTPPEFRVGRRYPAIGARVSIELFARSRPKLFALGTRVLVLASARAQGDSCAAGNYRLARESSCGASRLLRRQNHTRR